MRSYSFEKTLEFLGLSFYHWKFKAKRSFTPGNFTKSSLALSYYIHWNFQGQTKTKTHRHGNSTRFFLDHPWKFHFFFIKWNFHILLFWYPWKFRVFFGFFCLVLWEQFPCFSLWISWMPLCNVFLSVLIFDLYYFSLLYKDNNLYIIIIVWNFIVVFYTVCFLKVFYASLGAFKIIVYVLLNFYISLCAC